VRQRWLAQRGAEEARKDGIAKLAAWKAAPATAVLSEPLAVSRDQPQKQPLQVVDAALRADASALPTTAGVDLGAQGYVIVKVLKVLPREVSLDAASRQDRAQYSQWWTSAESLAYYNALKDRFKTEIKVAKPVRAKADQLLGSEATTTQ
jgi:peptidyl-prolyl cis-trans isomerase D